MQFEMEEEPIKKNSSSTLRNGSYEKVKVELSRLLSEVFEKQADRSCREQGVEGQETSITGALRGRINDSLDLISASINKMGIKGIVLQSTTFRQKEEGKTGADFVVTFEFFEKGKSGPVISKSTLVQAKTAVIKMGPPQILHCNNEDLSGQLLDIEKASPGKGYLMLYTDTGAFVVPAGLAGGKMKKSVFEIHLDAVKKSGDIVATMSICTGGDVNLSPKALNAPRGSNGRVDASNFARIIASHASISNAHGNADVPSVLAISAATTG
jgi:hypothetical protein